MEQDSPRRIWRDDAQRLRSLATAVLVIGVVLAALQGALLLGIAPHLDLAELLLGLTWPVATVFVALVVRAAMRGLAALIEIGIASRED